MQTKHVLIVDDEQEVTSFFTYYLQRKQCCVTVANSGREAERLIAAEGKQFQAAFIDLKLPDANGLDLMAKLHAAHPDCSVLIMTGYSTIKSAVTAIQRGAKDYLEKPFDNLDDLDKVIDPLLAHTLPPQGDLAKEALPYGIVYAPGSPLEKVLGIARKLAQKAINVLIEGETGTGKELLARYIHGNSLRSQSPFVALNCGAVPESLMESELFGYEKGAFTGAVKARKGFFELADNGTLFLDEIGEAPASIQVKLLRALETGEYMKIGGEQMSKSNIRFISATNRSLAHEVECKRFREDLLYRLEGVKLMLPPLRERVGDIPVLCSYYLAKKYGNLHRIDPAAMECLQQHEWSGNVRQLLNVLNQTIAIHDCPVLQPEHLPEAIRKGQRFPPHPPASDPADTLSSIEYSCSRFVETIVESADAAQDLDFSLLIKRIKSLESEIGRSIMEKGLAKTKGNRQELSQRWKISKRIIRYYLNEKQSSSPSRDTLGG
ncbi:sigma-54-dependent transcriptional regulator [Brevibacillus migulae]|uniref:sigma-54-dependent transcriptional regulator n=1 Tax=Brevibacillus migulae TaxID=1644114 RepID=UPI00106E1E76|nr:sigma-54 dependent transcriptional regulator [Brevibacillus migulae]